MGMSSVLNPLCLGGPFLNGDTPRTSLRGSILKLSCEIPREKA